MSHNNQRREMIDGAAAIARGALDAGCNFYAGYPITPASEILTHMLRELPKVGGIGLQGEDEISSLGHCIGAATAGATVFTATSGPGLSLYSENIGLAIMMEVPLVIAISQRLGPSTGAATASAQGDIQFMRWCTSGGYPVIVLSPTNIPESYHLTNRAFKLAKRFRSPVFIATDKETVMTTESVAESEMLNAPNWPAILDEPVDKPLDPYQKNGTIHHYTGSSHTEEGHITKDPEIIAEFNERLKNKIGDQVDEIALVKTDLQEGADTLIISYGVSARSMETAVNQLRDQGEKVSALTVYSLWPVPEMKILGCLKGIKRVIIPEMNHGQYRHEIERLANENVDLIGVNRVDTFLITPEEIIEAYYG
ncbi:MAG TPA: pyruvate flavodoxin/ferredoxin oxidoreductase [Candidatus Marinimicrobia bacterium]|nr:pyruvate flavodoxin/ferredoxin oxidoreductase [Candidatus Neomarinimicrobiota bacterium]MDP6275346.1 pyruvate flavodoxin/ferredoxin oxidoreductase [Candidatus Neomarinimicrobiota bacterium]MDP7329662.1 pyruvate flavodoxin/ferredoxin oxidoreductase [Candidatus Neomarinimicrobiota bacterium]MDP7436278.1 pyruvate flavodoxin/ferredoxin oxidoreductase [Candidatus Neomarinimicrobiota bacterium]HBN45028.1 pyruvate flavodoxin/ferredoxin oxidoreductase [Candidatus Neomarinimicrobiota bacterium]